MPYFIHIALPAFVSAVVALPIAIAALWRAGLVPGYIVAIAVLAALAPNVASTWWMGLGINAVWMVAVAVILARIPLTHWYGDVVSEAPADASFAGAAEAGERVRF